MKNKNDKTVVKGRRKDAAAPIQLKVTPEVRGHFEKTAKKFFAGNMSGMIRYAVYHCAYPSSGKNSSQPQTARAALSEYDKQLLADLLQEMKSLLEELRKIGVNVNQIAKQVNCEMKQGYPISNIWLGLFSDAKQSLASLRASVTIIRKALIDKLNK